MVSDKVAIARIDWAHQRQLADVAALIGIGVGIVECLVASIPDNQVILFNIVYVFLSLFFVVAFYSFFGFQREILKMQNKLDHSYQIKIDESFFCHFFDYNKGEMPKRMLILIPLCFSVFLSLKLLLLIKLEGTQNSIYFNTALLAFAGFVSVFYFGKAIKNDKAKSPGKIS